MRGLWREASSSNAIRDSPMNRALNHVAAGLDKSGELSLIDRRALADRELPALGSGRISCGRSIGSRQAAVIAQVACALRKQARESSWSKPLGAEDADR
jgi:hypothetical protein